VEVIYKLGDYCRWDHPDWKICQLTKIGPQYSTHVINVRMWVPSSFHKDLHYRKPDSTHNHNGTIRSDKDIDERDLHRKDRYALQCGPAMVSLCGITLL
jgi:hypothetical protein